MVRSDQANNFKVKLKLFILIICIFYPLLAQAIFCFGLYSFGLFTFNLQKTGKKKHLISNQFYIIHIELIFYRYM